ncbi:MAG: hypothetical protein RL699_1441 [Bacteroidota bacterium]
MIIYYKNVGKPLPVFFDWTNVQALLSYIQQKRYFNILLSVTLQLQRCNLRISQFYKQFYNVPLFSCSRSIDSNKALKFPAPNPLAPMR